MNIIKKEIIGGAKIEVLDIPKIKEDKIKGKNMFPGIIGLYGNIYLSAKKRSGKTTVLSNILFNCANKSTKIIIFCSTFHKDNAWIEIAKKMNKLQLNYMSYNSLIQDGVNQLEMLLNFLTKQAEAEAKAPKPVKEKYELTSAPCRMVLDNCKVLTTGEIVHKVEDTTPEIKEKELAPDFLFIFDDLSNELKDPAISYLMKRNRHFRSKVIVSSQYIHDLAPDARQQIDYCLLFGGIPEAKLKVIYDNLDLSLEFPVFNVLYDDATHLPYHFFKIDVRTDKYSENFDKEYQLPE